MNRGHVIGYTAGLLACIATVACSRRERVDPFPESFVGIGVELRMDGDSAVVVRSLTPAAGESATLLEGDRIVAVNGESMAGKSLGDIVMALRGAPDTQVSVTADRSGQKIIFVLHRRGMTKQGSDYSPTSSN